MKGVLADVQVQAFPPNVGVLLLKASTSNPVNVHLELQ